MLAPLDFTFCFIFVEMMLSQNDLLPFLLFSTSLVNIDVMSNLFEQ